MSPTLAAARFPILLAILSGGLLTAAAAGAASWAGVSTPSMGPPQVLGGASNGCLGGAEILPEIGSGYVSIRRARNRYYGHPELIRMIGDLGAAARARGLGLVMVGDLSQPRGGRMLSSHRSHQNGLDVDIWFTLADSPRSARRLMDDRPDPQSMVEPEGLAVSAAWGPSQRLLLETASRHAAVDRIFVNPAIKDALCREVKGDRGWLRKVRPWYGHDSHFHVRLRCPPGNQSCATQAALPAGDGCGADLAWWFSDEARNPSKKRPPKADAAPPAACMALLERP